MKRVYTCIVIVLFLFQVSCVANRAQSGAVSGAAGGALVGQAIGKNTEATLLGAAIGTMLGYIVGNEMDKHDRAHLNQVYETSPSHKETAWVNPDSGKKYRVKPRPAYRDNGGRNCREAEILTTIDGRAEKAVTIACRENGRWVIDNSDGVGVRHSRYDRDDEGDRYVSMSFTASDADIISSYYGKKRKHNKKKKYKKKKKKHLPPGLAKRDKLPPGLQGRYLPAELERRLSPLSGSYARVVIGSDLVLLNRDTNIILDILYDID